MFGEIIQSIGKYLDAELFRVGGTPVSASTLLLVAVLILLTVWLAGAMRSFAEKSVAQRGGRPAVSGTVGALIQYSVLLIGFGVAFRAAGVDLSALFTAGAIFAVGVGFALQNVAQNFVAGIILLSERSIKPGDVLEVEGKIVRVVEMGIRASIARSRDGEDLVIPNGTLIQTTVTNFTLRDVAFRIRATVGVAYDSDMDRVMETLTAVATAENTKWKVPGQQPQVVLNAFGSSAVEFEVAIWMNDPWERRRAGSELNLSIWRALRERGIVIAFPQLDVHLDDRRPPPRA